MAKHTPGPWEMEMDSNADYIVRNKQEFDQLQHENKRLREALEQIRDMPNRIYEGFSADGECSSHVVVAPDARKMQSIAEQALEGRRE